MPYYEFPVTINGEEFWITEHSQEKMEERGISLAQALALLKRNIWRWRDGQKLYWDDEISVVVNPNNGNVVTVTRNEDE